MSNFWGAYQVFTRKYNCKYAYLQLSFNYNYKITIQPTETVAWSQKG